MKVRIQAAIAFVALWACGVAMAQPVRYYGNMPFSIDLESRRPVQFHFTAQDIARDDNLAAFHMDWFPIPWAEFAGGTPPPRAWSNEIDRMVALKDSLQLPVYLAVTPLQFDRLKPTAFGDGDTLYGYDGFGKPCEQISLRPDFVLVRAGFHAFVDYLVDRFQPRFLALSIEVSNYATACPAAWPDMEAFLNAEYEAQKAQHPGLLVFHTFQVDSLWQAEDDTRPCFGFRRDCLFRNFAPMAGLKTDLAALSVYPVAGYLNNARTVPDDYLSIFGTLTGKPVAVAETGFPGDSISAIVQDRCITGLPLTPADQAWWMDRLLVDADRLQMPFVVWWANHAMMPFEALRPCWCAEATPYCDFLNALPDDIGRLGFRYFGLMALRDYDGTPRPVLARWTAAVAAATPKRAVTSPARHKPTRTVAPRS